MSLYVLPLKCHFLTITGAIAAFHKVETCVTGGLIFSEIFQHQPSARSENHL